MSTKPKIIIVGAGPAGIAAASKLIENGFLDVTVLEAETRLGGRINSVDFDGTVVDLGAQWVHGEIGNVVYEMVKDLDILRKSHNDYQDNTYYLSNGSNVSKSITDRLQKIGMSIIHDGDSARQVSGSFGDYFIKVYNEAALKQFEGKEDELKIAKYICDWFQKFFLCLDSATSWNEVSTKGAFVYESCEGNQQLNWDKKGYRTILSIMMKSIPDASKALPCMDKISLKKEVTKIVWDHNDINSGGVTVSCSDDSLYNADHVILTMSVGVLKRFHKDLFVPELPSYKVEAIENFCYGTVNKILLKFPEKWWPDDLKGFSLLWTDEDRANLLHEFPHGPSVDGRSWLEDVFGFYVIDSHPKMLLGWMVGKMAADIELLSDETVINGCMLILKKFAGNKYNVMQADAVLRSKWHSNPHFCGSYVHVGLDHDNHHSKAENLGKTVIASNSKQALLFAGEATHLNHFSTVHGAIETGYREAERIINIYK